MNTPHLLLGAALLGSLALGGCESELDGKPTAEVREASAVPAKPTAAPARTINLDSAASEVAFVGAKVTGDHRGSFPSPTGQLKLDGDGKVLALSVSVATAKVSIEPDGLAKHLRSADFFDAEKFPKATFEFTKFQPAKAGATTHSVTGNLSLHGVRKEIVFPATINFSDKLVTATASFKINRKDFGIVYAGMADDLIKDDVLLQLNLRFAG